MPFKVPELALCKKKKKKKVFNYKFNNYPKNDSHKLFSYDIKGKNLISGIITYRAHAFCSSCLLSSSSFPLTKGSFQPKTGSVLKIYV